MDADVVVVGGGLAGLNAARLLAEGGARVLLLEARDRVGGRTVSMPVGGASFDFGAQWIGPTQDRVAALAKRLGIATFPTWTRGRKVMEVDGRIRTYSGTIPSLPILSLLVLNRALGRIQKLGRLVPADRPAEARRAMEWDALTLEAWKRREMPARVARETMDIAVRGIFGAEASELSLLHFFWYLNTSGGMEKLIEIENGAQQDRLVGGTQALSLGMANELGDRVILSAPVETIEQRGDEVVIGGGGRSWRAKRVVVAVPPALAGRIQYQPGLPVARDQLTQRVPMGATTKIVMTYGAPFWREAGLSGEAVSTAGPVTCTFDNTTHDGKGALVAFLVGRYAREEAALEPARRRERILAHMVRFFGARAGEPEDYREQDWAAEIWTRGCPTGIMGPGVLTQLGAALREPVGRIHWAGTETATQWAGYMEGALQSGERAAAEALAVL
jgi:monoamine oxidase